MKIAAAVFTTHTHGYLPRTKAVLETWARDMDGAWVVSEDDRDGAVACPGAGSGIMQGIHKKMLHGLRLACRGKPDWVVVACSDAFVHRAHLDKFLEGKKPDTIWGRIIQAYVWDEGLKYPSGSCMILPGAFAAWLAWQDPWVGPISNDAWVGYRALEAGVPLGETGPALQNMEADIPGPDWISIHHLKPPERFYPLYEDIHGRAARRDS